MATLRALRQHSRMCRCLDRLQLQSRCPPSAQQATRSTVALTQGSLDKPTIPCQACCIQPCRLQWALVAECNSALALNLTPIFCASCSPHNRLLMDRSPALWRWCANAAAAWGTSSSSASCRSAPTPAAASMGTAARAMAVPATCVEAWTIRQTSVQRPSAAAVACGATARRSAPLWRRPAATGHHQPRWWSRAMQQQEQ